MQKYHKDDFTSDAVSKQLKAYLNGSFNRLLLTGSNRMVVISTVVQRNGEIFVPSFESKIKDFSTAVEMTILQNHSPIVNIDFYTKN